ncbi:hypothetical protein ACQ86N_32050 [Puia sp. P3]|uniref:hypothetical protein n=1 Tax=Puia sp. P3 TaxID=3423952 RepID=UPI003D66B154
MANEQEHSVFFRTMMTGLFVGIIDTVICLAYNIFYRDFTGYVPSEFINVSSLIFGINLVLLIIGMIYYLFKRVARGGDAIFGVVFLAVTLFLAWKTEMIQRFADVHVNHEFRGLLLGIVLICGVSAACLPLFYNSRKFNEFAI